MVQKQKFFSSFLNAFKGIRAGLLNHRNFKIQSGIGLLSILFGLVFHLTPTEWGLLTISIFLVLGMELMNTAVEELLDHLHPEKHEKVGLAKDIAAGAVLLVSIGAAIVGMIIFIPHLFALI